MYEVTVSHNFETAHRLPHLPGKCVSLHGHSWHAEITVAGPYLDDRDNILVEFGAFKRAVREFIDHHLDHGVMLGPEDPLVPVLRDHNTSVYELPGWPTVENVAAHLGSVAAGLLATVAHAPGAYISATTVRETGVNTARWVAA